MWTRSLTFPWPVQLVLWSGLLVYWAVVIVLQDTWPLVPVGVLATLAAVTCTVFRVTIGPHGIRAAALLGLPFLRVKREDIAEVSTTRVSPLGDFGGWGYRIRGRGDTGVVTRSGPALVVTTVDGRTLTVTVPHADDAAAALRAVTAH
jgi:hypothetical protein